MEAIQALLHEDHQSSSCPKPTAHFSRPLPYTHLFLLILLILTGIRQRVYAFGASAPNGPGAVSNWTPSNNTILGTAANTTSDVIAGGQIYVPNYNGGVDVYRLAQ